MKTRKSALGLVRLICTTLLLSIVGTSIGGLANAYAMPNNYSIDPTETYMILPDAGYTTVNEYVYVTASALNVRTGPGTGYKKVATLKKNAKVLRIAVGSNGWSKINLNGTTRYVSSSYLKKASTPSSKNTSSNKSSSTYTTVDEYVYVNASSLNVRTGPGTSYSKVTSLSRNTKVHRVAVGSNGWSKIILNGKTRYVSSSYLSKSKTNAILTEISKRGNVGRLKISSVGVDVALFKVSSYDGKKNQKVVDNSDSAAYMTDAAEYYGCTLIADHRHQGFDKIKKCKVGTTAVIDFGTRKETYTCTKIFKGKNTTYDLVDMNGKSIAGMNDGGICMYTCNTDNTITITFWQPK